MQRFQAVFPRSPQISPILSPALELILLIRAITQRPWNWRQHHSLLQKHPPLPCPLLMLKKHSSPWNVSTRRQAACRIWSVYPAGWKAVVKFLSVIPWHVKGGDARSLVHNVLAADSLSEETRLYWYATCLCSVGHQVWCILGSFSL